MATISPPQTKPFDYQQAAESILGSLKRDRDRQVIARRFGFGLAKRQTLERIGSDFGITRERVRQIEKAGLARLQQSDHSAIRTANNLLLEYLKPFGDLALMVDIAKSLGAGEAANQSYVLFLATLAPDVQVVEESDQLRSILSRRQTFDTAKVKSLASELQQAIAAAGQPVLLSQLDQQLPLSAPALENLARAHKGLANFEDRWGLVSWPQVNPKSIRDKTYLILQKHDQPLHFSDIAGHIRSSNFNRRDVTVQAVHNELIKDSRFVLIGRGIYALAEWGYEPGTVADIIVEILRQEQPLHKDEIVKRVLKKRQVKTTTIILNLQEKDQFERVAKATYRLKP